MKSLKTNRLILWISMVIFVLSIILTVIIPPYNYANLDRSKDQFKLLYIDSPTLTVKEQSDGKFDHQFKINVVNTTEKDLENVIFYIYLDDIDGQEYGIKCEAVTILANVETEEFFQSDLETRCSTISKLTAKIGDGEEFTLLDRDVACPTSPLYTISSVFIFISLVVVIVASVRVNKLSKRQAEIDEKAYESRVNDMVDLEIRQQRVEIAQQERDLGMNSANPSQTQQTEYIRCEYCGHTNNSSDSKCTVCGSPLKK